MIKNIYSSSSAIVVSPTMSSTYVNGYSGAQGVGNMRFNTTNQNMEVFDGSNWITLNMGSVSINLSSDAESLLNWAKQKRNEEIELEEMAKKSSTMKDLVEQIKEKQNQLKMVQTLLNSPGNNGIKPSMVP